MRNKLSTIVLRKMNILEIKMENEHNQYHSDAIGRLSFRGLNMKRLFGQRRQS
jgi:hypothetical protein